MNPPSTGTVRITVVPSPACHFCEDAEQTLAGMADSFTFELERVPMETPEGARLVAEHRPALSPLVLVDGIYFSAGRLPRKKLTKLLTARGASIAAGASRG
ncbi:MAG: glutaredoxin [Actinobacteria bacterium]|nr:glutaredoxin [Actinomycetota bacterium]MCG2800165.1 glutaredoxin [Cellulomonas sp.]